MASHLNFGRTRTSAISDLDQLYRAMMSYFHIFGIKIPSLTISFIGAKNMQILTSMNTFSRCVVFVYVFSYNPALKFRFVLIGAKIESKSDSD